MTPGQIIEKLNVAQIALTKGNIEQKTLALKKAEAKKNYSIAKAKKILILKAEKYPATLIQDLVVGDEKIAELRLQRDISESAYYTAISAMENLRLEVETLRSLLTWLRMELKNT
jgi:hypothetical protein